MKKKRGFVEPKLKVHVMKFDENIAKSGKPWWLDGQFQYTFHTQEMVGSSSVIDGDCYDIFVVSTRIPPEALRSFIDFEAWHYPLYYNSGEEVREA